MFKAMTVPAPRTDCFDMSQTAAESVCESRHNGMTMRHKLVLDIDPGIDDALALIFALTHPDIELLSVHASYGHVPLVQAVQNAALLCAMAKRADVPVCEGLAEPLRKNAWLPDPARYGSDGLGDWPGRTAQRQDAMQDTPQAAASTSGPRRLVELARQHPGELTLVCAAPLSGLAQALRLEPRLPSLLRQVVVAGGAVHTPGEVSPVAEFNFWSDPHAADLVLTAGLPLTMIGIETSRKAALPPAVLDDTPGPLGELLCHAAKRLTNNDADASLPAAGLLAVLTVLRPNLCTTAAARVRVATEGFAEGQSLVVPVDRPEYPVSGWDTDIAPVHLVTGFDAESAHAYYRQSWQLKQNLVGNRGSGA